MLNMINVNVLLIEDNKESREITEKLLETSKSTNFIVDSAGSLLEGLKKCRSNDYDVIILDLVLPNGQGFAVFKEVQSQCDAPIVIVSGYEDKAIECVKHGAQDYLVKPHYDRNILVRSIRYAIERHKWKKNFDKIVESTHSAIYEINFISNKFTYINDVALRETGYTKEEIKKMSPADLLTEDSLKKWLNRLEQIQRGIQPKNIEEYQIRKKDGSLLWVLITADYRYRNDIIESACVVAIDITEKKTQELRLESIYRSSPVAIGLLKGDRIIVEVNERLCKMLGYEKKELIGQNARILYLDDREYERIGKIKYAKIKETGMAHVETQWSTKNGNIIDVLLTSTYLNKDVPEDGLTFTALDITKTKEVERKIEHELNKRLDVWKSEVGIDFQNLNKLDSIMNL